MREVFEAFERGGPLESGHTRALHLVIGRPLVARRLWIAPRLAAALDVTEVLRIGDTFVTLSPAHAHAAVRLSLAMPTRIEAGERLRIVVRNVSLAPVVPRVALVGDVEGRDAHAVLR